RSSIRYRAIRLGLDLYDSRKDQKSICAGLVALRDHYHAAPILPSADQLVGWCAGKASHDPAFADVVPFLRSFRQELTAEVIERFLRHPHGWEKLFPLMTNIRRRARTPKRHPGRPATKKKEIFAEAR